MRPHASVVNYSKPQGSSVEEDQVEISPDPAPPPVLEESPEEETVQPKRRRKTADDE